ncbi:chymotrypsinogen B2 [Drosophila elegans]|uniref:chymotrypsinogen B2 n=1 Tax=Drosophila elegans TaxID=30023 RepID=UPI0007E66610|nr:chymotrypsinogen B2 [Drosophila elegans]
MTLYFIFLVLLFSFANGQQSETNQEKCSARNYKPYQSFPGQYPWLVALLDQSDGLKVYIGAGSLISGKLVLTAAHILEDIAENDLVVRGGEYNVSTTDDCPHQDIQVSRIIRHEGYNKHNAANNMALLVLKTTFDKSINVERICLRTLEHSIDGGRCFFIGWGKENWDSEDYPTAIKRTDIGILGKAQCSAQLKRQVPSQQICGTGLQGRDSTGDGGAPLICIVDNQFLQVGIVNWGKREPTNTNFTLFTDVAELRFWIDYQLTYIMRMKY